MSKSPFFISDIYNNIYYKYFTLLTLFINLKILKNILFNKLSIYSSFALFIKIFCKILFIIFIELQTNSILLIKIILYETYINSKLI